MNQEEKLLTLRDILRPIFKWRCQVLFITIVALVAGTFIAFLMPPEYTSTGSILVKRSALSNDLIHQDSKPGAVSNFRQLNQQDDINTVIAMLQSRDLIDEVIRDTGLTKKSLDYIADYRYYVRLIYQGARDLLRTIWNNTKYLLHFSKRPTPEQLLKIKHVELLYAVIDSLEVKQVTDSDVVNVKFSCGNRQLAQLFTQALCQHAITWSNRKRSQSTANLVFFENQAKVLKKELLGIERKLSANDAGADHIEAGLRRRLIVEDIVKAESKLHEAQARRDALKAGIISIDSELKKLAPNITVSSDTAINPVWLDLKGELATYKLKLIENRTKFSDESRVVKDLERQIRETEEFMHQIEKQIPRSQTVGNSIVYQQLIETKLTKQSELAATNAEIASRRNALEAMREKLRHINELAIITEWYKKKKDALTKAYNIYVKNAERARISQAKEHSKLTSLVIIQEADYPLKASRPVKWLCILAALTGGLLTGITWAFIKDFNDTSYWNPEQLAKDLGVNLIGTIPAWENGKKNISRFTCLNSLFRHNR